MDKFAIFQTPYSPPERSPRETFDWLIDQARIADQVGFTEFWCGEHATLLWEGVPNPELVLAAALRETDHIKLCPGAHLLPYHHPGSLAIQIAYMTHLANGRYILGVGAGAFPSDAAVRGITDLSKNHEMVIESLAIMERVWEAKPFQYNGKYWSAGYPEHPTSGTPFRDTRPFGGRVDMGMAGLSMESPSIRAAGAGGHIPLSIYAGPQQLANHWRTYDEAATKAGRTADRSVHHVVLDVIVADTDEEALKLAVDGGLGRAWREYILATMKGFGVALVRDVMDLDTEAAIKHLAANEWIVGSPDTVVQKFNALAEKAGGRWGTTMVFGYDYADRPEAWNHSLELLANEVGPRLRATNADSNDPQSVGSRL